MYRARWVLEISRDHFVKYMIANHCAVPLELIQNNRLKTLI